MYRYISKYHIGYDKKLKHVNYYGEPVIKQVKEHFIVVDRISNIRTKITSDTGNKAKSVLKPDIEPQISDTKKRVLVQENDTAIQDSEIEEITKTLDYKGVKGDSIAVQSVLKDYRKQFEVLRQQLAQKDKQLGEKDEQLVDCKFNPKLQEQISHTINPIKSVFSLIFIFYGLNLTGGSSGEKLFGCLIASLPAR